MNAVPSRWIENFSLLARQAGAVAWGSCRASEIPDEITASARRWIDKGCNASMEYLARHVELKKSLESVLPGCRAVISLAFPYNHKITRPKGALEISRYALSEDYHTVIKHRLRPLAAFIKEEYGGKVRTCVDSAPVAERYWAVKCGVGGIGRNGMLFIPGYGSWVFLAEILTTAPIPEKHGDVIAGFPGECENCHKCTDACPGHAIGSDSMVDCRKCRSYHTIENRDMNLPEDIKPGHRVYGCDICQEVCPLNIDETSVSSIFDLKQELLSLTLKQISELDDDHFRALVKGTAMERITLSQLRRNAGLTVENFPGKHNLGL